MSSASKFLGSSCSMHLESIEEEETEEECFSVSDEDEESLFSIDFGFTHKSISNSYEEEEVVMVDEEREVYYVAVGRRKSKSSMDALLWTLRHAVTRDHRSSSTTSLVLVHVFPPVQFIPSPLGMLPRDQVSPKMVNRYMAQERDKRKKLLDKYIGACSAAKVEVDTMPIESDTVAKAILDLISTQKVKKLVVGTTKSNMRKLRSKKGSGIASQILRNAPKTCDINIICKGKEVIDHDEAIARLSASRSSSSNSNSLCTQEEDQDLTISFSIDSEGRSYPTVKSPYLFLELRTLHLLERNYMITK